MIPKCRNQLRNHKTRKNLRRRQARRDKPDILGYNQSHYDTPQGEES
ncbi:MAG: hypothetical protein A4E45_01758 [Methanosaeta sp. PtaB.Bin039]|nr:MAG: hypothetical protein A4E45_01758 [Methanosaeta sp. PtaB.Bin039]